MPRPATVTGMGFNGALKRKAFGFPPPPPSRDLSPSNMIADPITTDTRVIIRPNASMITGRNGSSAASTSSRRFPMFARKMPPERERQYRAPQRRLLQANETGDLWAALGTEKTGRSYLTLSNDNDDVLTLCRHDLCQQGVNSAKSGASGLISAFSLQKIVQRTLD